MEFLGKENDLFVFRIKSYELLALRYPFLFDESFSDIFIHEFEKERGLLSGTWKILRDEKIKPLERGYVDDGPDLTLKLTEDELLLLTGMVVEDSLGLGVDCDSCTGTPYEDVYRMTGRFIEVLDGVVPKDPQSEGDKARREYLDRAIAFRSKMPDRYN
jgi:hypothetical protein